MPPPKKQTTELPESEWAFHKVLPAELSTCTHWELARHRGEARPPWLNLPPEQRIALSTGRVFREIPPENSSFVACIFTNSPIVASRQAVRCIMVEVDFSVRDDALKKAFLRWLDTHPERKEWQERNPNKTPNHRPWRTWLLDIVIYRAKKAGLKRKEALDLMWPLFEAWRVTSTNGRTSSSHWRHALDRAEMLAKPPAKKTLHPAAMTQEATQ